MRFCANCKSTYPPDVLVCPKDGNDTGERKSVDRFLGQFAGSYRIVELLGEGGMGYVYRAEHATLHKKAAIKLIHPELAKRKDLVDRFLAEAKTISLLDNENIVGIHDFGLLDGEIPYFVMEFLEGEPLSDLLERQQKLPATTALSIITQLLDALGTAHQHGIVHRDIKPANVFITQKKGQPFVKLLDFGIAKFLDPSRQIESQTKTGNFLGTPQYMSPEQIQGRSPEVDARSDLYSVGVLLYECLCGELPFEGQSFGDFVIAHVMTPLPLVSTKHPEVGQHLSQIIQKALHKKREDRFQSAKEMSDALSQPESIAAKPIANVAAQPAPNIAPKRTSTWMYALVLGLVFVGGATLFLSSQPPSSATSNAPETKPVSALVTSAPVSQPATIKAPETLSTIEPKPADTKLNKPKDKPKLTKEKPKDPPKDPKEKAKDPGNGTIPFGGGKK